MMPQSRQSPGIFQFAHRLTVRRLQLLREARPTSHEGGTSSDRKLHFHAFARASKVWTLPSQAFASFSLVLAITRTEGRSPSVHFFLLENVSCAATQSTPLSERASSGQCCDLIRRRHHEQGALCRCLGQGRTSFVRCPPSREEPVSEGVSDDEVEMNRILKVTQKNPRNVA